MKKILSILFLLGGVYFSAAQENTPPDFQWGNTSYYNLALNETVRYKNVDIELLNLENHFNQFRIDKDTLWIKVSRRSLPHISNGFRIFVADNKNVKNLTDNPEVHGLLKKDVLICLSDFSKPLLDRNQFIFPISFSDGFIWSAEENSHMFSYMDVTDLDGKKYFKSHEGIDIDLHDAKGIEKHLLVAFEKCRVIWVEDKGLDVAKKEACVLLESESQPGIYYIYEHLYNKKVFVKEGDNLVRGEPIGAAWGDLQWGHIQLAVVKSETVPSYENRFHNSVNFFPQLFELYFNQSFSFSRSFTKGKINFGRRNDIHKNAKNVLAFEDYSGKGWVLERWNAADRVEWISIAKEGNARLRKTLFSGKGKARNPKNYYDFEIRVKNGVFRIRALVGDIEKESWQKIEFEGVSSGTFALDAGRQKWTNERVVKVNDGKLTVRIYIDPFNKKYAGLGQIVFQQAY